MNLLLLSSPVECFGVIRIQILNFIENYFDHCQSFLIAKINYPKTSCLSWPVGISVLDTKQPNHLEQTVDMRWDKNGATHVIFS